jgi:hypothetical protein
MALKHREDRALFEALREEVAAWEASPYFLPEEELFDLERFLKDKGAEDLCLRLEQTFGRPLNASFWRTLLPYHKLRRVRLEIRREEAEHDRKRALYLESVKEAHRALRDLLELLAEDEKKPSLRLVRPFDPEEHA